MRIQNLRLAVGLPFFTLAFLAGTVQAQQLTLTVAPTAFTAGKTNDVMLIVTNQGASTNIALDATFQITMSNDLGTLSSVDSLATDGDNWSLRWLSCTMNNNVLTVTEIIDPVMFPAGKSFGVHATFAAVSSMGPGAFTLSSAPSDFVLPTSPFAAAGIVTFATGPEGATGATGANGSNGSNGAAGAKGATGGAGATGAAGTNGTNGATGAAGTNGTNGATGPTGAAGTDGSTGSVGPTGATGSTGASGADGSNGATGAGLNWLGAWNAGTSYSPADAVYDPASGSSYVAVAFNSNTEPAFNGDAWTLLALMGGTGSVGSVGAIGPTGAVGATGQAGPTGADGPTGAVGTTGANGTGTLVWTGEWNMSSVYTADAAVSENGSSYVALVGNTNVDPATDVAAQGATWGLLAQSGVAGAAGMAGAQGNAGPQGPAGPTGPTGAAGASGVDGAVGVAGANGANGAQGMAGAQGIAGATGAQGLAWSGVWATDVPYAIGDAVSENGSSFIALAASTGVDPKTDTGGNWALLAQAGATGAAGTNGVAGSNGMPGATGPSGANGAAGAAGAAGTIGPQGPTGSTGAAGPPGTAGATGATGAAGSGGCSTAPGATNAAMLPLLLMMVPMFRRRVVVARAR